MPSKKPFLSFIVEEELLEQIDNYRFNEHFESRAAAIKYLLKYALDNINKKH